MDTVTRPALRYHGGKFRLAGWIMQFFPSHRIYTEVFGGAAGVLLQKPRSHGEVYNDLDGHIVTFFRVLQTPALRDRLAQALTLTPYARAEFELAWEPTDDAVEIARRVAIRAQMGFGSAGATKGSTGLRTDTMRRYSTAQMDWASYPSALLDVAERFQQVLVENRPAVDVLQQHDSTETLHFVDPPYVHATREMRSQSGYRFEMSDDDHAELIDVLSRLQGMVVLSGYQSDLYAGLLHGWQMYTTEARASGGRGATTRTEVVWLNEACQRALSHSMGGLFAEAG
ncbi:DNA adenine methylase [Acidovorax sp. SUPP2825]|uniref:DNA adenine methylase n=1 Tax=Acidovorax sp. SUPP2825 TaxID=2920879 RepID=UPI0023DE5D8C|nr:DNA adenine methylase [Acidovorax sp. SUPP2825]GKS96936.1 DNA adenine methylase [Acidovorax sp. SUPP2825]